MAKLNDIVQLLDSYSSIIDKMNHSESDIATRQLALSGVDIFGDVNFGNCQIYIDLINDNFLDISLYVGTPEIINIVEEFNLNMSKLTNYLSNSWWQFGGDDLRQPVAEIPNIPKLHE